MSIFDIALTPLAIVGLVAIAGAIVALHTWREFQKEYGLI